MRYSALLVLSWMEDLEMPEANLAKIWLNSLSYSTLSSTPNQRPDPLQLVTKTPTRQRQGVDQLHHRLLLSPFRSPPNLGQEETKLACSRGCATETSCLSSLPCARSRGEAQLQTDSTVLDIP
jgi:hypothetical protein